MSLRYEKHYGAVVLPSLNSIGGVYCDGQPIPLALAVNGQQQVKWQGPLLMPQHLETRPAIFCGDLVHHFGHFLLESLSRLWFAAQDPALLLVWAGVKMSASKKYQSWHRELLKLLGITNQAIFIEHPTLFKTLYVPEQGLVMETGLHPEFAAHIARIQAEKPVPGKKVYLSRSKTSGGGCANEKELEALLALWGFTIIHPQEHSIAEQCRVFSSAEILLGLEGSAMHLPLIIDSLRTRIFCLERMATFNYNAIASVKKLDYADIRLSAVDIGDYRLPASLKHRRKFMLDLVRMQEILEITHGLTENIYICHEIEKSISQPIMYENTCASLKTIHLEICKAYYYKGISAYNEKSYELAQRYMKNGLAIDTFIPTQKHHDLYNKDISYNDMKNIEYELLLRREIHLYLCNIYDYYHDADNAVYEANIAIDCYPEDDTAYIRLASLLLKEQRISEALVVLDNIAIIHKCPSGGYAELLAYIKHHGDKTC